MKETETIAAAGSTANNYTNISREKTEKRANPAVGCQQPQGRDEGDSKPSSLHHRLLLPGHRARGGFGRQVPSSQFSAPGSHFEVLSSRFPVAALCARTTLAGRQAFLFRSTSFFLLTPRQVRCLQLAPAIRIWITTRPHGYLDGS